jgi:hypothetical protein
MQRLTLSAIAEGSHGKDGDMRFTARNAIAEGSDSNMQFAVRNAIAGGPDDRIIEPEF